MDMIRIGSFLAELRKEKGLTQEKLGEKLGVSNKPYPGGRTVITCLRWRCCKP